MATEEEEETTKLQITIFQKLLAITLSHSNNAENVCSFLRDLYQQSNRMHKMYTLPEQEYQI